MTVIKFDIPGEDAWIIDKLARILAKRLIYGTDDTSARLGLLRALFALQRLPNIAPGYSLSLGVNGIYIEPTSERCGLTTFNPDGQTLLQLQYFEEGCHCLDFHQFLAGDVKRLRLESILQSLEQGFAEAELLDIEDLSSGIHVDDPPLHDYLEYALSWKDS